VEPGSIPVAEGGVTVADVYARRADLAGQTVKVRGKVVKATAGVMGANWYHIQDGTGAPGANDLTVTTAGTAKVGDVVVIAGTVATDKDFGMGYTYEVIVEKATLTAE
jgi:DNA/RNA endonuclease YhcR with UshA esterase domain